MNESGSDGRCYGKKRSAEAAFQREASLEGQKCLIRLIL